MLGNLWPQDRVRLGFELAVFECGIVVLIVINTAQRIRVSFLGQLFWDLPLVGKTVPTGIRSLRPIRTGTPALARLAPG